MKNIRGIFRKEMQRLTASKLMALGFVAAILLGGFLLSLPVCNRGGRWLAFVDALFTSCSAVCVTGLVTIVPATQFTLPGKIVLLILIQLGGLGIIACTMGTFMILKKQITIRSRVMIQEGYDLHTMSGLVVLLRYVICGTFLVEGIGAVFYSLQFVPEYGLLRGIWYSVFHAISAFCNAGIDILGDSSLQAYQTNTYMNLVTGGLIIVSGLGFLVWRDLTAMVRRVWKKECTFACSLRKLKLHTKLALLMTAVLLIGGTIGIFCMEYSNPRTFSHMTTGQKWVASFFQSVTTRTAGFFTIPQNLFRPQSQLLSCILMFIGGCPGGTAGGVKTTTIAILFATCWSVLKGSNDTECYRRKILASNVRTAFAVFTVAFSAVLLGTMTILVLEPTTLINALYEVTSAVGTVGLTAGLTPFLSMAGKLVIVFLMYIGRIGPITLVLLFAGKVGRPGTGRTLPEERIMVG